MTNRAMFKRKNLSAELLEEEKGYNEAILRLTAARTRGEREKDGSLELLIVQIFLFRGSLLFSQSHCRWLPFALHSCTIAVTVAE